VISQYQLILRFWENLSILRGVSLRALMHLKTRFSLRLLLVPACLAATLAAQGAQENPPTVEPPVSYASVSQVNILLTQLEQTSQATQLDLAKLRIDRWKVDSGTKKQTQSNVDSLSRNLQAALPGIIGELRASPENLISTFKLYRNIDALYDVMGSVVESVGAFGTKDEFQSLTNDLTALENARRAFADRMETLAGAKEVELTRLRSQQRATQASTPGASTPKKVIVDDTEPPKKPAKKTVPKPPTSSSVTPAPKS